jgi:ubiquinone/menaquinone biosynthesis C-methylase UbiE
MGKDFKQTPVGAGKSSFELIDPAILFEALELHQGNTFLDLACGKGHYSIAASQYVGEEGLIYAMDLWKEGIDLLLEQIAEKGIKTIQTIVGDITGRIEIESRTIDVCLMATILHDLVEANTVNQTLNEVRRMIRPKGILAVMEFKQIKGPPGPPIQIRLSADEVEKIVTPYGFINEKVLEVGPYNYLSLFSCRS